MTTTLRIDDTLKRESDLILDDMGLNLSCAITIFLKELTRRRAMPFAVRASGAEYVDDGLASVTRGTTLSERYREKQRLDCSSMAERGCRAKALFAEMRSSDRREWTLDEINAEISAAREERPSRKRSGV